MIFRLIAITMACATSSVAWGAAPGLEFWQISGAATNPAGPLRQGPPSVVNGTHSQRSIATSSSAASSSVPSHSPVTEQVHPIEPLSPNHQELHDSSSISPATYPAEPFFHRSDRDIDILGRHIGRGEPLEGTSWQNRPLHVGWLVGGLFGDDLIDARVSQEEDLFGGYRIGWDFDHYWGTELRFAFSHVNVLDAGDSVSDRTARHHFYDLNLLYYPWGDSAWRPFLSAGCGVGRFRFTDDQGLGYNETLLQFPLGGGCKYYFRNWLALRLTLVDNWAVGGAGINSLHQFSITGDIEVHFGGRHANYFPWNVGP